MANFIVGEEWLIQPSQGNLLKSYLLIYKKTGLAHPEAILLFVPV